MLEEMLEAVLWEAVRKELPTVIGGRLWVRIGRRPWQSGGFCSGMRYFVSVLLLLKSVVVTHSSRMSLQFVSMMQSKVVMMSSTSEVSSVGYLSLLLSF